MLLATLLLTMTAQTAWADDVNLTVDTSEGSGSAARWYVNVPSIGTNTLTLSNVSITSFKVYDSEGKSGNYVGDNKGYLVLIAPAGYRFQLSGNIKTEKKYDYLTVYDGSSNSDRPLIDKVSSAVDDETTAIGPVTSTGNSMMLYFYSDTYRLYAGLDLTVTIEAIPWSGSGSSGDPYIIEYPSQLDLLAHRVNGTHGQTRQPDGYSGTYFKLGADITYDPSISNNYETIGAYKSSTNRSFGGKFDGQGYTVSGIRINKDSNSDADGYQGLFGRIMNSAEVKNVILADATITGYKNVGGIVGGNDGGKITDCHVLSNVTIRNVKYDAVCHGGIAGYNHDGGTISGTISGCTSAATLADENNYSYYVGGIAGHNTGSISQCLYLGTSITGYKNVGAIVGLNYGPVNNCYFTDTQIQGKDGSGSAIANTNSAVGENAEATVTNCGLAHKFTLGTRITLGSTATAHGRLTIYGDVAMAYNNGTSMTFYSMSGSVIQIKNTLTDGYTFDSYTVKDADNGDVTVAESGGVYTFTMPAKDVTVSINFTTWSGSGTKDDPYIINNKGQLNLLAHRVNGTYGETVNNYSGTYFKLGADIKYDPDELTIDNDNNGVGDSNYEAIGGYHDGRDQYFEGIFDGQGHTVSGIRIYKSSRGYTDWYQGLFGEISDPAEVKNVILADATITGFYYTSAIVGYIYTGTVSNCHALSTVTVHNVQNYALDYGGIAGYNYYGTVTGCTSAAALTDATNSLNGVGGIVGANNGTVSQCIYLGTTLGGKYSIGAIAGENYSQGTVETSYFTDVQIQGKDCYYVTLANAESAVGYKQSGTVATTVGPALRDDADNTGFLALLAARNTALTAVSRTPALSTDVTLSYSRTFTAGVASTICLPFAMTSITGGTAYEFTAMNKSGDDWIATMEEVTSTVAGKPYLFKASADGAVSFSGTVANGFDGTAGTSSATYNGEGSWTFRGTYTKLTYGTNLDGAVYGFAAQSYSTNINPGDFVKAQTDAYIPPFRCYLTYNEPSSARQMTRGADIELPSRIIVRLVNKNGSPTAIGTMDTKTGEVVFGDAWYTLDGRRIEGQPSTKGVYINNGKKVIVK